MDWFDETVTITKLDSKNKTHKKLNRINFAKLTL